MPLSDPALRVLGSLLEKERATPDAYPLTSQALLAACNQKTAREPVTSLHLREVEEAMRELRDRGLAATVRGSGDRVPKHRQRLVEALSLTPRSAFTQRVGPVAPSPKVITEWCRKPPEVALNTMAVRLAPF